MHQTYLAGICAGLALSGGLVFAKDSGVPPRASASDYAAKHDLSAATLAASVVPAKQVEKLFSSRIAKDFVVVEVAVYPENGRNFDVDWFDFGLKTGDTVAHVEHPREVAMAWPEKTGDTNKPVTVITDTGVAYGHYSDSTGQHRNQLGTYENVDVTNDPRSATPPNPGPDPQLVEARIQDKVLPQGHAKTPLAGYLFFPRTGKKHKGDLAELQWSKDRESARLKLPIN